MPHNVPKSSLTLMGAVYLKIFPEVNKALAFWRKRAEEIPDDELRRQALSSIHSKQFHCLGGAAYALLAGRQWKEAVRFIVAYQTISDYLDNLCDRSTSMDPNDFRLLHEAMSDALTPECEIKNYYAWREEQKDGHYLADLVQTCQKILQHLEQYPIIRDNLLKLEQLYSDLQVHKHVKPEDRISRLINWHQRQTDNAASLYWYEFSAAAGSTLGVFCLVSYTMGGDVSSEMADLITESYFPFMQGLHILLDYYIDQEEDRAEGDLNFCRYYDNHKHIKNRFIFFIKQADNYVQQLPDRQFHEMVHHGLVGLYLGDPKVKTLDGGLEMTEQLLRTSGMKARFFHWNTKMYHRLKTPRN